MSREEWSQNQVQRLTKMLKAGKSFNEIACALGRPKNAVIGKAHRLGLKSVNDLPESLKASVAARTGKKRQRKAAPAMVAEPKRLPLPVLVRSPRPSDGIWRPKSCQFPLGDPGEPDFHFCGAALEPADGRSYCPEHHRRCYLPPKEKGEKSGTFQMHGWAAE